MIRTKVTSDLLKNFRQCMKNKLVDAYIIPIEDAHNNEYLAECDKKIAYISGFTGSYALAVITQNKASLWTDGRYFEQASHQLDENWTLMKTGLPETPTQAEWLNSEIQSDSKIGFFKHQLSMDLYNIIQESLHPNRSLTMLDECLVSTVWPDRPPRPANPLMILPESFTGKSWKQKIDIIRQKLADENVCGVFFSALDEIAWLFNLRGSDISHNPVFFAFCFVTATEIHLLLTKCIVLNTPGLCDYLFGDANCIDITYQVQVHDYKFIDSKLRDIVADLQKIWIDPRTCYGLIMAVPEGKRHIARSPVAMLKAVKCAEEIAGMKLCSINDSIALCRFFYWLECQVEMCIPLTEAEVAEELDRLRSLEPGFVSLSFDTISCSGRNGGLIHYRAQRGQDSVVSSREIYLCDSGGQYVTGTTDVTRTVHFGQPTAEEKFAYTLVLKGHIALASLTFPEGTQGSKIDAIARMALWHYGMDYRHGTGHGVGAFLNVHEGPYGLSTSARPKPIGGHVATEPGLMENMVLTIEPGFYKSLHYGIRIENDYFLTQTPVTVAGLSSTAVKFLKFEPLTFFPIQTKLIDLSLLMESEIQWINEYHKRTHNKLADLLRAKGYVNESRWLMRETDPIYKPI